MAGSVDIDSATETTPKDAPVSEPAPLTGKEKAGVFLTWGIIALLATFLVIMLSIFVWGEYSFASQIQKLAASENPTILAAVQEVHAQRASFREFWTDTLQLIMMNVLFPTLTALLGYVFGTSRNNQ